MVARYVDRHVDRRTLLRGAGVGALGLAGAALIGCGSGSKGGDSPAPVAAKDAGLNLDGALGVTAPAVAGTPKKGGTFTTAMTGKLTHDPANGVNSGVWPMLGDMLLEADPRTAALKPSIAASWESPDPLTVVFKIKPGLKITNKAPFNGRNFDATDVAWNLERHAGLYADRLKLPKAYFQRGSLIANLAKAEAVDASTVKVTLSKPNSAFFSGLSNNRTITMPKEMDDLGFKDPMKFGGIGPWDIVEYKDEVRVKFVRNKDFTLRANEQWFDEVIWEGIADPNAVIAAFSSKQIDAINIRQNPEALALIKKARPDSNVYSFPQTTYQNLRPTMKYAPFRDARVRRALHLAIDYADLGTATWQNDWVYTLATHSSFEEAWSPEKVKALPGYNPDTKKQDREEAAKLLTAAGFPGGKGLSWEIICAGDFGVNVGNMTRYQGQMKTLFPDMDIRQKLLPDKAAFDAVWTKGEFQMQIGGLAVPPDPVLDVIQNYHSKGSRNYGSFNEPALDAILDKAIEEVNRTVRKELFNEFQKKYQDEWRPDFLLHLAQTKEVLGASIGGFDKLTGTFGPGTSMGASRMYYVNK